MKNQNKKGFTIVELVIVIAVIAILAAVLIPTFAGLVNKANESADIQAVRQMNTALAIDSVDTPTTQGKLFEVLGASGMDAKNYKPLYNGRYFYWDKELNQVLYVDAEDNIIFPENVTPSKKWYSLSGEINTKDATIEIPTTAPTTETTLAVANGADFVKAAEYITKYNASLASGTTITIELTSDINLMGADINFTEKATSNVNVVFKSSEAGTVRTISGLYISDAHATHGKDAQGNASKTYGHSLFNHINNLTVSDIKIVDSTVGGTEASQASFFAGQINGTANFTNVTVENCDVYGSRKVGVLFGYGHGEVSLKNVTIKNCNIYAADGEAGAVFGVLTMQKIASDKLAVTTDNVNVTGCTVKVTEGSNVKKVTINGIEYELVKVSEDKYRVATAGIGFIATNADTQSLVTYEELSGAKLGLYKYINTIDELADIKGSKAAN